MLRTSGPLSMTHSFADALGDQKFQSSRVFPRRRRREKAK